MVRQQIVMIPREQIRVTFFVRTELNEDHALVLGELYESGVVLPPLVVVRDTFEVVDGRHRLKALELLNTELVPCILVDPKEEIELIADGFKANVGGSLPPSRADTMMVIRQCLENGLSQKKIISCFENVFPPSITKRYIKDAQSTINKAKMQSALRAVAEGGITAPKAAESFGIPLEKLQEEIKGKRSKRRASPIAQIRTTLSRRSQGETRRTTTILKNLIARYEDGEITADEVNEVFEHVQHLNRQADSTVSEWLIRFKQIKKTS